MNKADIMRQPDMGKLLRESIKSEPGITSAKLFERAKEWAGRTWEYEDTEAFDKELFLILQEGYRVTNQGWYVPGAEGTKKKPRTRVDDPRQTRMF